MSVGPTEVVMILIVVFLLFGTRRLADLGKGIGEGIRGFKQGIGGDPKDEKEAEKEEKPPEPPRQLVGRIATQEELGAVASSLASSTHQTAETLDVKSAPAVAVAEASSAAAPREVEETK